MNQSHAQLFKEVIGIYSNLNLEEYSLLLKLFGLRKYKNKEHIISSDEDNSSVFFIVSGLVRYYYLTSDGKEWKNQRGQSKLIWDMTGY
jgi:CRP-like cAMP-binding protein